MTGHLGHALHDLLAAPNTSTRTRDLQTHGWTRTGHNRQELLTRHMLSREAFVAVGPLGAEAAAAACPASPLLGWELAETGTCLLLVLPPRMLRAAGPPHEPPARLSFHRLSPVAGPWSERHRAHRRGRQEGQRQS